MVDVELTGVDWLWFPYIPFGKLTIIQGNPGEGKTYFAMRLAEACTNRKPLPGMETLEPFNIIYQTAEDLSLIHIYTVAVLVQLVNSVLLTAPFAVLMVREEIPRSLTAFSSSALGIRFPFASNSRMSICACAVLLSVLEVSVPARKDWNDVLRQQGDIPSRKFIAETITLRELPTAQPGPMLRMADVELTSVDWLWFPYIPCGKLTIIQGNPGEGKTYVAMRLAASCTNRKPLPGMDTLCLLYTSFRRIDIGMP